ALGFDGVLAGVAGLLLRQRGLVVAEVLAVVRAVVGGGAGEDVLDVRPRLLRQGTHGALGASSAIRARTLLGGVGWLPGLGTAALPTAGVIVIAEETELARPCQCQGDEYTADRAVLASFRTVILLRHNSQLYRAGW